MQTSPTGIDFIAGNEGLTLTVKNDEGHEMIGYGHDLLPGESFPNGITEDQARDILVSDLAKVDAAMNKQSLALDLNQN